MRFALYIGVLFSVCDSVATQSESGDPGWWETPRYCTKLCGFDQGCGVHNAVSGLEDGDVLCINPFTTDASRDGWDADKSYPSDAPWAPEDDLFGVSRGVPTTSSEETVKHGPWTCPTPGDGQGNDPSLAVHMMPIAKVTAINVTIQSACTNVPAHIVISAETSLPGSSKHPDLSCVAFLVSSTNVILRNMDIRSVYCTPQRKAFTRPLVMVSSDPETESPSTLQRGVVPRRVVLHDVSCSGSGLCITWTSPSESQQATNVTGSILSALGSTNTTYAVVALARYTGPLYMDMRRSFIERSALWVADVTLESTPISGLARNETPIVAYANRGQWSNPPERPDLDNTGKPSSLNTTLLRDFGGFYGLNDALGNHLYDQCMLSCLDATSVDPRSPAHCKHNSPEASTSSSENDSTTLIVLLIVFIVLFIVVIVLLCMHRTAKDTDTRVHDLVHNSSDFLRHGAVMEAAASQGVVNGTHARKAAVRRRRGGRWTAVIDEPDTVHVENSSYA